MIGFMVNSGSGRRWAVAVSTIILLAGCADADPGTVHADESTAAVSQDTVKDVSPVDLRSAEVPAYCNLPRQRLRDGETTRGSPGQGWIQDKDVEYGFADLAGLGYKQGIVAYMCTAGGVSWPQVLVLVGRGGDLLASYDLGGVEGKEHADVQSVSVKGRNAVVDWSAYEGAAFFRVAHRSVVTYRNGKLELDDTVTDYSVSAVVAEVVDAVVAGDRLGLVDQQVIGDAPWSQLVEFADGASGFADPCEDTQGTTQRCPISLESDYSVSYYVDLERSSNKYGWRVTDVVKAV